MQNQIAEKRRFYENLKIINHLKMQNDNLMDILKQFYKFINLDMIKP